MSIIVSEHFLLDTGGLIDPDILISGNTTELCEASPKSPVCTSPLYIKAAASNADTVDLTVGSDGDPSGIQVGQLAPDAEGLLWVSMGTVIHATGAVATNSVTMAVTEYPSTVPVPKPPAAAFFLMFLPMTKAMSWLTMTATGSSFWS